jgi:hypothetical protein
MAYRQFVCWVRNGQPLGKKYRVTLPACVVKTIREEFPPPDGNYEGFAFWGSLSKEFFFFKHYLCKLQ